MPPSEPFVMQPREVGGLNTVRDIMIERGKLYREVRNGKVDPITAACSATC